MFVINFMKYRWVAAGLSLLALVGSFTYTFVEKKGFNKDLDFAGGMKLEIDGNEKINLDSLDKFFDKNNFRASILKADKGANDLLKIEIDSQQEVAINAIALSKEKELSERQLSASSADYLKFLLANEFTNGDLSQIQFASVSQVGPALGDYLLKSSVYLLLVALALITVYVAFRFRFRFAVGAMVALVHDVVLTIGVIGALQIPLSIPVIAALLTILGYSINDTVVIFDRIRENMGKNDSHAFSRLIDISVSETLGRTIITSLSTILGIIGVYLFGGETLEAMALTLIIGFGIGVYSTIYIASACLLVGKAPVQK